ncbi:hypothetical protein MesoLj113b_09980 [Mesorhizobium sp. 113-3-3]|nr:hypothetical protein MesoLj113b_09980 [Mesorhizobium sp. 113-3-3]
MSVSIHQKRHGGGPCPNASRRPAFPASSRLFRRKLGGDLPGHRLARQARAAGLDQRAGDVFGADDHDINVFHGYFDPATITT